MSALTALGLFPALTALAVVVVLSASGPGRRWALAGLTLALLGASSLAVGAGSDVPRDLASLARAGLAPSWVIEAGFGLVLLGLGVMVIGARALVPGLGAAAVLLFAGPLLLAPGLAAALGIAAIGAATLAVAWGLVGLTRPGRVLHRLDALALAPTGAPEPRAAAVSAGVAAGLVAALTPHILAALGGALAAGVAGMASAPTRTPIRRLVFVAALAPLILATLLAVQILGPLPGGYAAVREGPFSEAAAILLVVLLLVPCVALAGVWPLHGAAPGTWLAPAVVGLLRFAAEALPAGLLHWQRVGIPLAVLGVAHGVARTRAELACAAAGLVGLWSGSLVGGALLIVSATLLSLAGVVPALRGRGSERLQPAVWSLAAVGGALTLRAALQAEVVYTMVLVVVVMLGLAPRFQARASSVAPSPS